jgi:hypothetical protein
VHFSPISLLISWSLTRASLRGAYLRDASPKDVDFYGARVHGDLTQAVVGHEQLAEVASLEGPIMPNGTRHSNSLYRRRNRRDWAPEAECGVGPEADVARAPDAYRPSVPKSALRSGTQERTHHGLIS